MRDGGGLAPDTELRLSHEELELVRTALRLLESTLGREEADELAQVKALLARLEAAARRAPDGDGR